MSSLRVCAAVVVVGMVSLAGVGEPMLGQVLPAPGQPVFRTRTEVVNVGVSVRRGNRSVAGLGVADFDLADNGVLQQITSLSYEKLPIDMTVLLDVSSSVTGAVLDRLRRSVDELRRHLQPADRLRLVTFNMKIQRLVDLGGPTGAGDKVLASVTAAGSSAVIDALAVALTSPELPDRRHFIALFSDGEDSTSITAPAALLNVARRTSATVGVVLAAPVRRMPDPLYTELAAETGGTVVSLLPREDLGDTFHTLLEQFRSSYVLQFVPSGVPRTGVHTLDLRVRREGVDVRARRGYGAEIASVLSPLSVSVSRETRRSEMRVGARYGHASACDAEG